MWWLLHPSDFIYDHTYTQRHMCATRVIPIFSDVYMPMFAATQIENHTHSRAAAQRHYVIIVPPNAYPAAPIQSGTHAWQHSLMATPLHSSTNTRQAYSRCPTFANALMHCYTHRHLLSYVALFIPSFTHTKQRSYPVERVIIDCWTHKRPCPF